LDGETWHHKLRVASATAFMKKGRAPPWPRCRGRFPDCPEDPEADDTACRKCPYYTKLYRRS